MINSIKSPEKSNVTKPATLATSADSGASSTTPVSADAQLQPVLKPYCAT